jgi:tetratricopeptide (TPR) repeat protein
MTRQSARRALVAAALATAVCALYFPVVGHDFVALDDGAYVVDNPRVRAGLGVASAAWAFGTFTASNWHPLAWISHLLDVRLFGLGAGGHHLTNLLLHAANSALLLLALAALTGALWRSALVAAFFALHPLHVESVAWVAERKDVLCALFWMLTLLAYRRYAARPGPARYLAVAGATAAALLSKPMAVTLPFVLLLLDYWPLGRWRPGAARPAWSPRALLLEKLPLIALSAGAAALTLAAQRAGGAVGSSAVYPFALRAANAVLSVATYARQALWPADLAVFYPFPRAWPGAASLGAAAAFVLAGFAAAALWRRSRPALSVGWLWYLGTLVPVLGLVQVGDQAHADRYTYLPLIGLFVAAAWALGDVAGASRDRRRIAAAAAGAALLALAAASALQLRTWKDSATLFARAVEADPRSHFAHTNLAAALLRQGATRQAVGHLFAAIRFDPSRPEPYLLLAGALVRDGDPKGARGALDEGLRLNQERARRLRESGEIAPLERAIAAAPDRGAVWRAATADEYFALGAEHRWRAEPAAAEAAFREAVRLQPAHAAARRELARLLGERGARGEALAELQEAVRLDPEDPVARNLLGIALGDARRVEDAAAQFAASVRLRPDSAESRYNLARALELLGRRAEAADQYREALRLSPGLEAARRQLRAIEAAGGR